jgi:hypothetical protein
MTDITSKLERIALVAEVANHYIDDMRVMPAAGVADTIREAMAQLESTMRDDRAYILEERDRTFALMLARVEKAEAERDRLRAALEDALAGQPQDDSCEAWATHARAALTPNTGA